MTPHKPTRQIAQRKTVIAAPNLAPVHTTITAVQSDCSTNHKLQNNEYSVLLLYGIDQRGNFFMA